MSEIQTTETTQPVATDQTTTATAQPILSSTEQPTEPVSGKTWKEAISEEYRSNPNIEKFTELDALAKSYINAVSRLVQIRFHYQAKQQPMNNGMKYTIN
jgi:hypothetical protein